MKKKLNIWVVNQFASTPTMPGKQRDYQYANAYSLEGHNVTLWRSSFSHWSREETIKDNKPYVMETNSNLNIMHLKTSPLYYKNNHNRFLNMLSFARAFSRTSRTVSSPPDVIIATYPSPFAAFAANRIARRFKAKFILEIGDLWPQVWIERKAFPVYHPFIVILSAIQIYLFKRTRLFVSSLPYVNDFLKERGVKDYNFTWIPNGINLDDFTIIGKDNKNPEAVEEIINSMKSESEAGKLNVIYVGGIGVGNRVDRIVQSAKILKDRNFSKICFHIIGDGHSKESIIKYVTENRLDSVKIWPPVVRRSVPYLLKNADAGIQCLHNNPIYRYGVNLSKIYDYMSAELPVIFSAEVRNNLVDQYNAGITVPPGNPAAIADALQQFASLSPDVRSAMGRRGYEGVISDYDINILSKRYLNLIES